MLLEEDVFYDQWVLLTKLCYHLPCFILYSKAKLACYFRYLLIHRLNFPGSYAILLFIALDLASITSHIHNWVLFLFDSTSSFFLELFLHWSPVAFWAPTDLGSSSSSILYFCLFILFMGFSRQEYWSGLPFPSPVDHILSDLSTMTRLSWGAPHGMASFHWVRQGWGPCDQFG